MKVLLEENWLSESATPSSMIQLKDAAMVITLMGLSCLNILFFFSLLLLLLLLLINIDNVLLILNNFCKLRNLYVAKCNLGKVKIEASAGQR